MGCDIHLHVEREGLDGWSEIDGDWYSGRNYELFALLADVRNRGGITPIAEPRGLPANASAAVRKESDEWGADGHSHSWLALDDDLFAFDWTSRHSNSALIYDEYPDGTRGRARDIADYATRWGRFPWQWRGQGVSTCQGVSGPNAEKHLRVEWSETASAMVGSEFLTLLLSLARLSQSDGDHRVRIVFWFDN